MTDTEKPAWKTLAIAALKDSIAHWERLRDERETADESPTAAFCGCCTAFYDHKADEDLPFPILFHCARCPIGIRSGMDVCEGTPWRAASEAWRARSEPRRIDLFVAGEGAIQAEIDYLVETLRMVEADELTCTLPEPTP